MSSSRPARPGTYRPSRPVQGAGPGQRSRGGATRGCRPRWRVGGAGAACAHPIPVQFPGELRLVLGLGPLLEVVELVQAIRAHNAKADRLPWPCDAAAKSGGRAAGKRPRHNTRHPLRVSTLTRNAVCPPNPHTAPSSQLRVCPQARSFWSAPNRIPTHASARPPRARELSRSFLIWSMTILKPMPMPKPTTVKPTMRAQLSAGPPTSPPKTMKVSREA